LSLADIFPLPFMDEFKISSQDNDGTDSRFKFFMGCGMELFSAGFQMEGPIPTRFTCEGENISPEFSWSDVPLGTGSFVLKFQDPNAPRLGGFTHWVMFNIPANVKRIDENIPHKAWIPRLGSQARNSAEQIGYMGPCPYAGFHRYFAWLYALRGELNLQPGVSYQLVMADMQGLVIAQAELIGVYAGKSKRAA
jgi:Raf kinase inhibitor-like YbhB/YbcL family protein